VSFSSLDRELHARHTAFVGLFNRLLFQYASENSVRVLSGLNVLFLVKQLEQELSYRKQIARQLRTQFVEDISVTLKSLEMWVRGH